LKALQDTFELRQTSVRGIEAISMTIRGNTHKIE